MLMDGIGHLVELANADAYDERYKKWNIDDLPIIPQEWQFIVSAGKNEQFKVLRGLMNCDLSQYMPAIPHLR